MERLPGKRHGQKLTEAQDVRVLLQEAIVAQDERLIPVPGKRHGQKLTEAQEVGKLLQEAIIAGLPH